MNKRLKCEHIFFKNSGNCMGGIFNASYTCFIWKGASKPLEVLCLKLKRWIQRGGPFHSRGRTPLWCAGKHEDDWGENSQTSVIKQEQDAKSRKLAWPDVCQVELTLSSWPCLSSNRCRTCLCDCRGSTEFEECIAFLLPLPPSLSLPPPKAAQLSPIRGPLH